MKSRRKKSNRPRKGKRKGKGKRNGKKREREGRRGGIFHVAAGCGVYVNQANRCALQKRRRWRKKRKPVETLTPIWDSKLKTKTKSYAKYVHMPERSHAHVCVCMCVCAPLEKKCECQCEWEQKQKKTLTHTHTSGRALRQLCVESVPWGVLSSQPWMPYVLDCIMCPQYANVCVCVCV